MARTITVERDVMVPMRDGVRLATDVYRIADADGLPVIVQRTPYSKSNARLVGDLLFNPLIAAERGFAVVVQDVRGRFASQGHFDPFVNEANDGFDCIEWAASQSWSSGRVGICGSSFPGAIALLGAVSQPPSLAAVLAYLAGANFHNGWAYTAGAFELGFNLRLARVLAADSIARQPDAMRRQQQEGALDELGRDPAAAARQLPLRDIRAFSDGVAPHWRRWLDHPRYDELWQGIDVAAQAHRIAAPVLHVTGWYDIFLRGHLDLDAALRHHPSDHVRDHSRLAIGPWDHGAYMSLRPTAAGDVDFGPAAASGAARMSDLALSWFGRWLRDDAVVPQAPRVSYFLSGASTWKSAQVWPPEGTRAQRLYLHSGGHANTRHGDGRLDTDLPREAEPADTYVYDPCDPVPTVGGRTMHPELGPGGIKNQRAVEERTDVLVYTSEPMTTALDTAGPAHAELFVATDAEDTDFTAKVVDVAPDGYAANVAEGILRLRYREGFDREEFIRPGEVVSVTIDLCDFAHRFRAGHRIRVEVSSSNFPRFNRNSNTRVDPGAASEADARAARQHVHHSVASPSSLTLPVMSQAGHTIESSLPPSTMTVVPVTYDARGDARKATTWPNSSASP